MVHAYACMAYAVAQRQQLLHVARSRLASGEKQGIASQIFLVIEWNYLHKRFWGMQQVVDHCTAHKVSMACFDGYQPLNVFGSTSGTWTTTYSTMARLWKKYQSDSYQLLFWPAIVVRLEDGRHLSYLAHNSH